MRILVADDSPVIRAAVTSLLRDAGYEVVAAEDGIEAIQQFYAHPPDLVLLDIKMPKDNGLKILQQIRTEYPGINVIIVTGYKSVETATEAVRLGASGYIVKPFKSEDILAVTKKNME